jgi:PAS domain S-box-containing protein
MGQEEAARGANLKPVGHQRWKLLESAPDAILIVDRTGQISFVNSHAERMFGYAPHELLGQPVEILVPEAARPAHVTHRFEFGRTPRTREMGSGLELKGRRKDGTTFPVEISLSPLEEPEGQFVVSAIRDVTERRQIQEALRLSEERFRRLVDEVKDYAIFMLDPEGKVKTWNEGAERIKGYRADEIIGRNFSCFYSSEDAERGKPEEQLKIAAREGRSEDDGWRIRKDGSRFWASVVITALHDQDGRLLGFSKVTRDITERKRIREAFLLEVTNALLSNLDISKLLAAVGLCIRQVKPFDYATLALYDSETKRLRIHLVGTAPGLPPLPTADLIPITGSPHGWSYISKKPLLLKGLPGEEFRHELPQHLAQAGVKSGCWIPLIGTEGPLGTLNLFSLQPNAFQAEDLDALGQLASQVAVALDNALAFQRMADLNTRLQNEKLYLEDELRTSANFD